MDYIHSEIILREETKNISDSIDLCLVKILLSSQGFNQNNNCPRSDNIKAAYSQQ